MTLLSYDGGESAGIVFVDGGAVSDCGDAVVLFGVESLDGLASAAPVGGVSNETAVLVAACVADGTVPGGF